ncbi:metallopeptidase [Emericellopsis cladophorae]|uniref:Metallopeptidase n=1 Tax=Emericellopsis cladophorae TaxID=2686198 RepID=A0A9Q0BCF7_9HYPO|nr:metallopeptidase [Emericellopsis cladophorae]KAI6779691.1 metallopeptidase [Emericellopsis cladophorae]
MMANNQVPLNGTKAKHDRRVAAVHYIQDKFGEDKVKVVDPAKVLQKRGTSTSSTTDSSAATDGLENHYNCLTEKFDPSSVASILVGLFREIPRWEYGSVVNFAAYGGGYPQDGDAEFAALRLWEAAEQWNSYDLGVKFAWVDNLEDAAFVLEYGGDKEGVLASAFFPNSQPLSTMFVYKKALETSDTYRKILKNIFLHELGHVLGLRHEFALDPHRFEGGALIYGARNPKSVMSYEFPPEVQESDITDTKGFYKLKGLDSGMLKIKDYIPG